MDEFPEEGSSILALWPPSHGCIWKGLFFIENIKMRCKWLQPLGMELTQGRCSAPSYPKKPTSQLRKQARKTYQERGNSGNRWGKTIFNLLRQRSESRITLGQLVRAAEVPPLRTPVCSENTAKPPSAQRGTATVLLLCRSWYTANKHLPCLCIDLYIAYHMP